MVLDASERHSAKSFLNEFDPKVRRKARARFTRGEIGPVWLQVRGGRTEVAREGAEASGQPKVDLKVENANWGAECACGGGKCEHVYAAMMLLLRSCDQPEPAKNSDAAPKPPPTRLDKLLFERLGRKLAGQEATIVRTIREWYHRVSRGEILTKYEVNRFFHFNWYEAPGEVTFTSDPPANELAFWHELAAFLARYRCKIPGFLQPVTDMDSLDAISREIRRREAIDGWTRTLATVDVQDAGATVEAYDFRLNLNGGRLRLEYRRADADAFRTPKVREVNQILRRISEGEARVLAEAWPIVQAFGERLQNYGAIEYSIEENSTRGVLSTLIRASSSLERLVNGEGVPYERAALPLRWEMKENQEGDYILRLVDGEGNIPDAFAAVLPGEPFLYLTASRVYQGPHKPSVLTPGPHVIPAPALETEQGVQFLTRLRLPLPPRLDARAVKTRLAVVLTCELARRRYDQAEFCAIRFEANGKGLPSPEHYTDRGWSASARPARDQGNNRPFYIFDRSALAAVPSLVAESGLRWDWTDRQWRWKVTKNFAEKFLEWYRSLSPEIEVRLLGELASLVRDPVLARVDLECEEVGVDWFDLKTTIRVEDTTLSKEELQLLFNAKGKAVRLEGKGWRRLEYELTEEEDACLAKLGLSAHEFSSEPQRLHALQLADRNAEKLIAAEQLRKIQARASEIKTRVAPPVPAGVRAELRPYQVEGFHFLAYLSENSFGGVLADDMGLGKTVQTLCWLAWLRQKTATPRPSVVVCPKSVMDNWASEAVKFVPDLRVKLWGAQETKSVGEVASETDLLVLNYSQLRSLSDSAQTLHWEAVILDEAQAIKNPDSQTAQAARALKSAHRVALSGTPIENRLMDLWSIMAFSMPGILGNRTAFRKRFDQANDKFARRRLGARVRPFLLRRTKSQVAAELPDRIEEDLVCEMEGTQKTLYRAEFKRAQQMLLRVQTQEALNEFRFNFLTSLLRLRQICCHPALVDQEFAREESAKLNALMDVLEPLMEEGHKVLVFSQFVGMLNILQASIKARKWASFFLAGDTENRGDLVNRFQAHEGSAVFLISLKAGGFGLNLTSASYVVIYDPWWNPAVENQAIDRTHRIGQTEKVIAYRLLTKGSIEEKIRALQRQKSTLADDVLGDEAFSASLTLDDLHYLFSEAPEEQEQSA